MTFHSHLPDKERRDNVHRGYGFPAGMEDTETEGHLQKEDMEDTWEAH